MTDERYTFVEDAREKKRTARGYYNKVRQGGRMKLPYDYLTAKEKKELNGDIATYSMNERMNWKSFKKMPMDIQKEYIDNLRNHGGGFADICTYLDVNRNTLYAWNKVNGIPFPKRKTKEQESAWENFIGGNTRAADRAEIPEPPTERKYQSVNASNIAALLSMLEGTGAKLTIEVTL